jgi:endonuclease/exonuclease/phosphatase family metal-dependent hydrolase
VKNRLYQLIYRVQLLLALLTLLAFYSPSISPNQFWPAAFLSLMIPILLVAHLGFVLWWLIHRRYYLLVSLACIVAGWGHLQRIAGWAFPSEPEATETAISVLTYNVHGLRHRSDNSNVPVAEIAELAVSRNCDVLCLQEFPRSGARLEQLSAHLAEGSRLRYHYSDPNGNFALFSAHPIVAPQTQYFPNRSNGYQQADLRIGDKTVRVFNAHLQTNAVTRMTDKIASEGDLKEKQTWLDIRGVMGRFRRSARQRALQSEEIARLIAGSPHPVLLCGDFNDTPYSYTYRTLADGLQDAFAAKGRGLGITYAGRIPALRIDYVLADQRFRVLDHRIEKKSFSDHRAVWSRVGL